MTDCTCSQCLDERDRRLNSEAWRVVNNARRGRRRLGPGWLCMEDGDIWVSVGE